MQLGKAVDKRVGRLAMMFTLLAMMNVSCGSPEPTPRKAQVASSPGPQQATDVSDAAATANATPPPASPESEEEERKPEKWLDVPGLSDVIAVVAVGDKFCALRQKGAVVCSGVDDDENVDDYKGKGKGNGKGTDKYVDDFDDEDDEDDDEDDTLSVAKPWVRLSGLAPAVAFGTDSDTLCTVDKRGRVQCLTVDGEKHKAVRISGVKNATAVAMGYDEACALTRSGALYCWKTEEGEPARAVKVKDLPPLATIAMAGGETAGIDRKGRLWEWRDGAQEIKLSARHCKPTALYIAVATGEDTSSITCTEDAPVPLEGVQGIVLTGVGETLERFYAHDLGGGVYAYRDKAKGDTRGISKSSGGAVLHSFVEDFALPADTERIVSATPIACAVSSSEAVHCWGDENEYFGHLPKLTKMRAPMAIATDGYVLCALNKTGTVSCMSLEW